MQVSVLYYDLELTVEGDYTKGAAGSDYDRHGNPGVGPEPASFDLKCVKHFGLDVTELLDHLYVKLPPKQPVDLDEIVALEKAHFYPALLDLSDKALDKIEGIA